MSFSISSHILFYFIFALGVSATDILHTILSRTKYVEVMLLNEIHHCIYFHPLSFSILTLLL